jgi:DNA-binding CsgD family transcriptional regulator
MEMETTDLVGLIYESIGDFTAAELPLALTEAMRGMAQMSQSRGCQFGLIDRGGKCVGASVVGYEPAALESYLRDFAPEDPRLPYVLQHPLRWIPCQQTTDPKAFERSALVNELLDKVEARFVLGVSFPVGPQHTASVGVMRGRRDGQYGAEEVRRLTPLLPHINRAMSLYVRIGRLESTLASLDALVDRLSTPILLVDRTGLLRYANPPGQEALRRAQHLVLRDGRVHPRSARQAQQFTDILARVLSNDPSTVAAEPSSSMRLLDAEGHAAVLVVQGLRGQANLIGMPHADAVLFLIRSDEKPPTNATRLQMVFELTPAETRLAEHLVSGKNLSEIGEELRVGRETLKSQLRSLFAKTDTRRQGELIALLISAISVSMT